jgi:hypothetical protein
MVPGTDSGIYRMPLTPAQREYSIIMLKRNSYNVNMQTTLYYIYKVFNITSLNRVLYLTTVLMQYKRPIIVSQQASTLLHYIKCN